MDLSLFLLIGALICFVIAAFNLVQSRVNLVALGLALWVTTAILPSF